MPVPDGLDAGDEFEVDFGGTMFTVEKGLGDLTLSIAAYCNIAVITVQSLVASMALTLSARASARAYCLFPLMFFNALFTHAFFDLRRLDTPVTASHTTLWAVVAKKGGAGLEISFSCHEDHHHHHHLHLPKTVSPRQLRKWQTSFHRPLPPSGPWPP